MGRSHAGRLRDAGFVLAAGGQARGGLRLVLLLPLQVQQPGLGLLHQLHLRLPLLLSRQGEGVQPGAGKLAHGLRHSLPAEYEHRIPGRRSGEL